MNDAQLKQAEAWLCDQLEAYCDDHNLEKLSADELRVKLWHRLQSLPDPRGQEAGQLYDHINWLTGFELVWDATMLHA